jgi:hypothetical protein
MIVLAYLLKDYGISKWYAELVDVDEKEDEIVGNKIKFINEFFVIKNPYGDIYFAILEPEKDWDVETNMTPLFVHRVFTSDVYSHNIHVYAFKIFYEKIYEVDDKSKALNLAREEYNAKFGTIPSHYIVGSESDSIVHVTLCSEVPKDEAIKIIREYEPLILWELSGE